MCFRPPSFEGVFITCPKCGTDIPKDSTVCPACGAAEDELADAQMAVGERQALTDVKLSAAPAAPKAPKIGTPAVPVPPSAASGIPPAPSRRRNK